MAWKFSYSFNKLVFVDIAILPYHFQDVTTFDELWDDRVLEKTDQNAA